MRTLLRYAALFLHFLLAFVRSRREQAIINLALQQQLATYSRKRLRPKQALLDRAFWAALS